MSQPFRIGKLKFKQGTAKPTCVPKKMRGKEQSQDEQQQIIAPNKIISFEPKSGSGTITTSGRTIHGNNTLFRSQVESGDSIIVENPIFKTKEQRNVTLILSDKSILLEEPFVEETSAFVSYLIKKKPKVIQGQNITAKYKKDLEELEKTKTIKKDQTTVRLKKGFWSYEQKKIEVNASLSREELLNVRQKMIKDKHCW